MSSIGWPPKGELSRLGPISPEIDTILDDLYEKLNDPEFDGDPSATLLLIEEMLGEKTEHSILEEMEPDPGLFPDYPDFDIAAFTPPEALNTETSTPFNSSIYLRHMMHEGPASRKSAQDPSFSTILKQVESFLAKPPDSGAVAVAKGPEKTSGRWVRCKFVPAKKVDRKPKRLGPEGTWVNDTEGEEGDRTRTLVQRGSTVTALQRQDTLTD